MMEVATGIISAALLTGEPFGAREAVGAALIIAAGATEFTVRRRRASAPPLND